MYRAIAVWQERMNTDIGNTPDVVFDIAKEAYGINPVDAVKQVLTYFENEPYEVHVLWEK